MNEDAIRRLQMQFGLTYHVPYLLYAEDMVGLAGQRVLEVGGSLPRELVLGEFGAKQWIGLHEMSYWSEITRTGGGTHPNGPLLPLSADVQYDELSSYEVRSGSVESLPSSFASCFDLIFSIATFEHLLNLPIALGQMHTALRPGGTVFAIFAPIWSSHNGHHLPDIVDSSGRRMSFADSPIPPWGHLLLRPADLFELLLSETDPITANRMVYYVFHSPHINRLFAEDFLHYAKASAFRVEHFDGIFAAQVPRDILARLRLLHPCTEHFDNNGILTILRKRAERMP